MHCISFSTLLAGNGLLLPEALFEILVNLQHAPFFEGQESQSALL